jgi:hypothetical protein
MSKDWRHKNQKYANNGNKNEVKNTPQVSDNSQKVQTLESEPKDKQHKPVYVEEDTKIVHDITLTKKVKDTSGKVTEVQVRKTVEVNVTLKDYFYRILFADTEKAEKLKIPVGTPFIDMFENKPKEINHFTVSAKSLGSATAQMKKHAREEGRKRMNVHPDHPIKVWFSTHF